MCFATSSTSVFESDRGDKPDLDSSPEVLIWRNTLRGVERGGEREESVV